MREKLAVLYTGKGHTGPRLLGAIHVTLVGPVRATFPILGFVYRTPVYFLSGFLGNTFGLTWLDI